MLDKVGGGMTDVGADRARVARALGRQRLSRRPRRRGVPLPARIVSVADAFQRDDDDAPLPPRADARGRHQGAARAAPARSSTPRSSTRSPRVLERPGADDAGGVLRAHRRARAADPPLVPDEEDFQGQGDGALDKALEEQLKNLFCMQCGCPM